MGSRYIVSGVQLGMFKAFATAGDDEAAENLLNNIVKDQKIKDSYITLEEDVQTTREFYDRR